VVVPEVQAPVGMRVVPEERTDPPGGGAARRFELHHVGTEAGEKATSVLAALVDDLEHAQIRERAGHVNTPASSRLAISAASIPRSRRSTSCVSSPIHGGPRRIVPPGWTSERESRNGGRSSGHSPVSE